MRISVTQLRVLLLVVNVVLAGGLLYKALAAHNVIALFQGGVESESHPAAVELSRFVYVPDEGLTGRQDPTAQVMRVSSDLQPVKPEPPKPVGEPELTEKGEEGTDAASEEELPEGPLAEEWEYVYYIAWQGDDSGVRNFAQLRKKEAEKATNRFSSRNTTSRLRTSRTRTRVSTRSTRRTAKKPDTVSFLVSDRHIQNEEFDLDFWVHSADHEKLVYWMPGRPSKRYALPYTHEGSYLAQGPMRRELRPEEDEEKDEEKEDKKHFYIIQREANPEEAREKRYEEIITGKTSETAFGARRGKRPKARAESEDDASGSASKLQPSLRRPAPPSKEDIQELKSAINKIPKAEQDKLKKELQGMLQGKAK